MGVFSFFKNNKTVKPLEQKGHSGFTGNIPPSLVFNNATASWIALTSDSDLMSCYENNPIVPIVINTRADALSNLRFKVQDLKSGEIVPIEETDDEELKRLILQPNPLQTSKEWLKAWSINNDVFGDAYIYAAVPLGYENLPFTYKDITVSNVLGSYLVEPELTGNFLESTIISEIIKYYSFNNALSGKQLQLSTNQILHINNSNIKLNSNFTTGVSKLTALRKPISNINGAFESRNKSINQRGASGFISSDKKDADVGTVPFSSKEVIEMQADYKKYGGLDNQYDLMFLNQPTKYTKIGSDIKDLMLFEEVESNTIIIAHSFGVPAELVKAHIQGAKYDNLNASERRLYDSTIIPLAETLVEALNAFYKTAENGKKLIASFDHVKALQADKKQEAETNAINERAALSAFNIGAITYNEYLKALGLPNDDEIGELRVWDLAPERIAIIKAKTITDGTK